MIRERPKAWRIDRMPLLPLSEVLEPGWFGGLLRHGGVRPGAAEGD